MESLLYIAWNYLGLEAGDRLTCGCVAGFDHSTGEDVLVCVYCGGCEDHCECGLPPGAPATGASRLGGRLRMEESRGDSPPGGCRPSSGAEARAVPEAGCLEPHRQGLHVEAWLEDVRRR